MSSEPGEGEVAGRLDEIIAYLDSPHDPRAVWRGLHFMEANHIEFELRYRELHSYLTSPNNAGIDNPHCLAHERERAIVLALREIVRRDLQLPPLSNSEKQAWRYEKKEQLPRRNGPPSSKKREDIRRPSNVEAKALSVQLECDHPDLMRALRLIKYHNEGVERVENLQSYTWIAEELIVPISLLRPDLDGIDTTVHAIAVANLEQ